SRLPTDGAPPAAATAAPNSPFHPAPAGAGGGGGGGGGAGGPAPAPAPNPPPARFHLDLFYPQIEPENLVGQNLGYAHAFLPQIDGLLVSKEEAQARDYALVIGTNRLIDQIEVYADKAVDLSAIP
ncbi:MAG: hypothetical protein AAFQ34_16380, partial [Pseudomonadota bacterium]